MNINIPAVLATLIILVMCFAFYVYGKFSEIEGGTEEEQGLREKKMLEGE